MTRTRQAIRKIGLWAFTGLAIFGAGCQNAPIRQRHDDTQAIGMPAPGSVPSELAMVNLPEYVIEPPDVLRIEALIRNREGDPPKAGVEDKRPFGQSINSLPFQPVFGEYAVRPDGSVNLGYYGSVPVAGLTLKQAASAIRAALAPQVYPEEKGVKPDTLLVIVDVTQYNSKTYTVIVDGGGAGERVTQWPITGNETVLKAIANIGGLAEESSKRNIWVARRTPFPNQPQQILPVDYVGITQHGITTTNYQIFPGDRVYLKAQRLVTIDRTLARIIAPAERLLGVTLLGASTVNQISGRGLGFGGNIR